MSNFALEGVAELMSTLERVRTTFNSELGIAGVLLTMADHRTNLGQQVAGEVRGFFKERVFETMIPRQYSTGGGPKFRAAGDPVRRQVKGGRGLSCAGPRDTQSTGTTGAASTTGH